jgi:predicted enzyme related to lactoylglutathione lyase|tara:strand:+ start:620 stop:1033 length:414 start_codon:yes stop_codon:yes gene_type:complete
LQTAVLTTDGGERVMNKHETINYLEFPSRNLSASKAFFSAVFGWTFTDYGPEYTAFSNAGMDGGLYAADQASITANGSALVVFYSDNLEATQDNIESAGGLIVKPMFSFPGGRRFQFTEPAGNEFAEWTDRAVTESI